MAIQKRTINRLWQLLDENEPLEFADIIWKHAISAPKPISLSNFVYMDDPSFDTWHDFSVAALREYFDLKKGLVYVLINPVRPDLLKVGLTRNSVQDRINSLEQAGTIGHFVPIKVATCYNRFTTEARLHAVLHKRCRAHKEFFEITWNELQPLFDEICEDTNARAKKLSPTYELKIEQSV